MIAKFTWTHIWNEFLHAKDREGLSWRGKGWRDEERVHASLNAEGDSCVL
jgi:hypothetical protein